MILTYDAVDEKGRASHSEVDAPSAKSAVEQLRQRGLYVTNIQESRSSVADRNSAQIRPHQDGKLPIKVLVVFTRQMAMLLRAGSSVVPAMASIRRQMQRPRQTAVLDALVSDLEEGVRLSDALRKFPATFGSVYCAVIAAGEASASLPEMFERLAGIVAQQRAMRNKLIGAVTYPALLICMSVNIFFVLLLFVIPRFQVMFTQLSVEPPASTQILLWAGTTLRTQWGWLLASAVCLISTVIALFTTDRGRQWLADVQLSIPLIGRIRGQLIQTQIFRTMGTLLDSGVGVLEALELVNRTTRNRRFVKLFDDLRHSLTSGGQLGETFERSRLIEPYVCQAVHTGEESGNIGGSLIYCADMLEETNTELINTAIKLIEPAILIVMGFIVGGVAISLFVPLFDLTSAMR